MSHSGPPATPAIPIFSEPVVRAQCGGVPVVAYGYTYVLTESPDLVSPTPLQVGNLSPRRKVKLKKSWEISSNRLGATAPRMPRTAANDYLPLEAIHLIDGDAQTCWSSKSQPRPDGEPAWIRLDLVAEAPLCRLVLRKRPPGAPRNVPTSMWLDDGAAEVGMGMPKHLTIRLSRDARQWTTVFDGPTEDRPERRAFTCEFAPQVAKQIWVIGSDLARVENWLYSFTVGAVEVYTTDGENLALATRGTGVTVSSTQHSMGQTTDEHRWLWPLHTDLGLKWVRVGYHDDPINWHWVEKEPGKLAVDPEADAAIAYLADRGVNVVMALGFGNRHYTQADPARHLPQLWEWYYENPAPPTTPSALEAWARYVRYMAERFHDRVRYFELWNEWNISIYWGAEPRLADYLAMARTTLRVLREVCPETPVMLGSVAGFAHGLSAWSAEELARQEQSSLFLGAVRALAPEVNAIGWHPFYQTNPELPHVHSYAADVRAFQDYCRRLGFHGEWVASEWSYGATYPPPAPPNWWGDYVCSELEKAKLVARLTTLHTALGVGSFFCETWSNYYPMDLTLLRRSFAADPVSPQQPQAAYYAMRNLATALEGLEPASFAFEVSGVGAPPLAFAMARNGERVLALWRQGQPRDHDPGRPTDVCIAGPCQSARVYDPLTGTLQELRACVEAGQTRLPGMLVRDYPLLLRLS